ncbi:MAG: hypothetical protein KF819_23115 [Labilithrix sp.]|nr:hypothetical protein [Labilithrix sp.]
MLCLSAVAAACGDGAKGPPGEAGQPAPVTPAQLGESVSLVSPSFGVIARKAQVTIAVDAYKLIDPTVDFGGAGVKVRGLEIVNDASIIADLEIAAEATLGARDVIVSDEGKRIVATAAFKVVPALETVISGGAAAQGGLVRVDLKNRDRIPLAPFSFQIAPAKATTGTLGVLARGYLTATDGQFVFIADPRAVTGPLQLVGVNDPDDPDSATFLSAPDALTVGERSALPITPGTPRSDVLAAELATGFFRYPSPANAIVDVRVSALGDRIAPVLDVMPPAGTLASEYDYRAPNRPGPLAYVNGAAPSLGDFVIVSDASFGGGMPADYKYTLAVTVAPGAVVAESATPHPAAAPQDLGLLPAADAATPSVIVNGEIVTGDTADVYRVDAGGTSRVQVVAMSTANLAMRFHPTDPTCPAQTSRSFDIEIRSDAVESEANVGVGYVCVLPSGGGKGKYTIAARRLP